MFSKRRKLQLVILILFIAVCGEAGVHASTDCERWVASYKEQLAHAKVVRRMQAANARLKRLAQRKLATYVKPKPRAPKVLQAHYVKPEPHYTKEQILERFTLLCGDLPTESAPKVAKLVEGKGAPEDFVPERTPWEPMEFASTEGDGLIPPGDLPPYTPYGGGPGGSGGGGGGGGFSGPPIFGGGGHTGGGGTGDPLTTTTNTTTLIAPVPEPGSLVLLLTGIASAAGAVRRRRQA